MLQIEVNKILWETTAWRYIWNEDVLLYRINISQINIISCTLKPICFQLLDILLTCSVSKVLTCSNKSPTRCNSFSSLLSGCLFKRQDNKREKLLHLVGDLFELYDDTQTYKL